MKKALNFEVDFQRHPPIKTDEQSGVIKGCVSMRKSGAYNLRLTSLNPHQNPWL
jgi:hypothetical protein